MQSLTSLQYINLEGNQITELRKQQFGRLPVVFELNLQRNQISNISVKAFSGLLQLLKLNLSENQITKLKPGAFESLVSLSVLDLSKNKIPVLENNTNGILEDLLSLEYLNISHNHISFIRPTTFPKSPYIPYKLKHVDLSYNFMLVKKDAEKKSRAFQEELQRCVANAKN